MPNTTETDHIRSSGAATRRIDAIDRSILSELTNGADLSYADLGRRVALSAPAVHERVKRLRASGHIKGTAALIDGPSIGKPLLAFIHVDTVGWGKTTELMALSDLPELEEIHSVTGDTCMLLKARLESSQALEGLLAKIYDLPSVRGTRTYVVLSTYLERPTQAGMTQELTTSAHIKA